VWRGACSAEGRGREQMERAERSLLLSCPALYRSFGAAHMATACGRAAASAPGDQEGTQLAQMENMGRLLAQVAGAGGRPCDRPRLVGAVGDRGVPM
jgi:hypothetical protein